MKKITKRIMALMLSLVMVLGCIPSFINEASAEEPNFEFCLFSNQFLRQGLKIEDVNFTVLNFTDSPYTNFSDMGKVDNLSWYKVVGGEEVQCESGDVFEDGFDYVLTLDYELPDYEFVKEDDNTIGDVLNITFLADCYPFSTAKYNEDLNGKGTLGWNYSSRKDKINCRFLIEGSDLYNTYDLKYFYDGVEVDNVRDLLKEDTILSKISVGTSTTDRYPLSWTIFDGTDTITYDDTLTFQNGYHYEYLIEYYVGEEFELSDYTNVLLDGAILFNDDYGYNDIAAPFITNCYRVAYDMDDDKDYICINCVFDYHEDPILDYDVSEVSYTYNDPTFTIKLSGTEFADDYAVRLYKGSISEEDFRHNFLGYEAKNIGEDVFTCENGEIECNITCSRWDYMDYRLINGKYTLLIMPVDENDNWRYRNMKIVPFECINEDDGKYVFGTNGMNKDESIMNWFMTIMMSGDFTDYFTINKYYDYFNCIEFDELPNALADDELKFSDVGKAHATFAYFTFEKPTNFKFVTGTGSNYNDAEVTYNKDLKFYSNEEYPEELFIFEGINILLGDAELYEELVDFYSQQDMPSNCYNYKYDPIYGLYKVIVRLTYDFTDKPASTHTTKKYKATDNNDTTEKITGTGKKGSTRTIVPEEGRKVASVIVTDKEGNKIDVTFNEDGTYSFTQPASNVNVEVNYKNREITLNIGSTDASVDGEHSNLDVAPVIRNDRTMLPIRFVAENLGAKVEWSEKNPNYVAITRGDTKIEITLGSDIMLVNGKEVKIDSVAFAENDRTYLPVRAVSEALNAVVEWNESKPNEVKIYER